MTANALLAFVFTSISLPQFVRNEIDTTNNGDIS